MKTIGRYEIQGILGRGGMCKVYKVRVPGLNKIAALKSLEPRPLLMKLMGAERLRHLFTSEASMIANLRHPHILDVWTLEADGDRLFYLMDYFCHNLGTIMGETYWADAPCRVLKLEKAVQYTRQTLEGLARLHHAGIIHRDIKPFNIMLTDQDTVKIADFGLSKLRGETASHPDALKIGTPFYAAPEQENDPDDVDFSADLYAVGVMLFRMLTGVMPGDLGRPSGELNPELNEDWDAFFHKSLAPDPTRRFARAVDMQAELDILFLKWRRKTDNICRLAPAILASASAGPSPVLGRQPAIRTRSRKVNPVKARDTFGLDALWRPKQYRVNHFEALESDLIVDHASGLIWQKAGSPYPLNWEGAFGYIRRLNETRYGGIGQWRLPTIDELCTLLRPPPQGEDLCLAPLFDGTQKWLWSCDRKSYRSAWYVNFEVGFVTGHDCTGFFFVKGVANQSVSASAA